MSDPRTPNRNAALRVVTYLKKELEEEEEEEGLLCKNKGHKQTETFCDTDSPAYHS